MIRRLPNLLIVGGQKCGTTWIHRTINKHPEVFMSKPKELFYFSDLDKLKNNFDKYLQHFDVPEKVKIVGESSTSYLWTPDENSPFKSIIKNPKTPETIKKYLGKNVKIIIAIRNPVSRAVSAFYHHFRQGRVEGNHSINDYLNQFGMIELGFFKRHITKFKKVFPSENIKYVLIDDIKANPKSVVKSLTNFLDIDNSVGLLSQNKRENSGFKLTVKDDYIIPQASESEETVFPKIYRKEIDFLIETYRADIDFLADMFPNKVSKWKESLNMEGVLKF